MRNDDLKDESVYHQERVEQHIWQQARSMGISRRRFMQLAAAGAGVVALTGLPVGQRLAWASHVPVVKPTPADLFYNYGSNREMRFEVMANKGYLVPIENFFVRNHTSTPHINVSTYKLRIFGSGVRREIELSYDDILEMSMQSETKYIECAGNGRRFFNLEGDCGPRSGSQWYLGAIGVAEWTGVPLGEVLERAGLRKTAVDVMPEGLDPEFGTDGHVRKPHSIQKALEDDTLLAVAMNGQTLPEDHGFPVRLLVPGWVGINSIKWVGSIEVSETPLFSAWNTKFYILENIGPLVFPVCNPGFYPCPPPVVTEQNIKSAFEISWPVNGVPVEIPAGRPITGRAWSPFGKIEKVEVRVGEGEYMPATLSRPNIPKAWVRWSIDLDLSPGTTYILRCRAADEKGNTQPDRVPCNRQGYLYNAVVGHPVTVVAS